MKIIISSARTMKDYSSKLKLSIPIYYDYSQRLKEAILDLPEEKRAPIFKQPLNKISETAHLYEKMDDSPVSPALFCYDGTVFKQIKDILDPSVFSYLTQYLRILSAYYGILKPFDGIHPYRLEMNSPLKADDHKDLYDFWSYRLYEECRSDVIVNLASEEYGRCVRRYLNDDDFMLDIDFLVHKGNEYKRVSGEMKKARGQMLRYMILNQIEDILLLKDFDYQGYSYSEELSSEKKYVFIRESQ